MSLPPFPVPLFKMRRLFFLAAAALLLAGCPHDLTRLSRAGDGGVYVEAGLSESGPADAGPEAWLDACVPSNGGVEICDGLDNDCNGAADDGFDLQSDPNNCGSCNNVCATPNATPTCTAGQCAVGACAKDAAGNSTHWNNDGDWKNGCEHPCSISAGGLEVCDKKDNDCDGDTDEKCENLSLLYSFGDAGTRSSGAKVFNLASPGIFDGQISGTAGADKAQVGIEGDGMDGRALFVDGSSGLVTVELNKQLQLANCDSAYGWSSAGGAVAKDGKTLREG